MAHIVGNDIDFAAATLLVTDDLVGASKAAEVVDAFAKLTQLRTAQHKAAEELAAKAMRVGERELIEAYLAKSMAVRHSVDVDAVLRHRWRDALDALPAADRASLATLDAMSVDAWKSLVACRPRTLTKAARAASVSPAHRYRSQASTISDPFLVRGYLELADEAERADQLLRNLR